MSDLKNNETDIEPEQAESGRRWIYHGYARKGARYTLILSLVIFAIYTIGSLPDPGFSDRMLFFLLRLLRYSSLLLCACSLFAMGFRVHYLVYHPSLRNIFGLFMYFLMAMLGAALAMLNSFIVAAAGGHGG